MSKRPRTRHGTPWKEEPKVRRNDKQKQKIQEKNYLPKDIGKISDETSEDDSDWKEIEDSENSEEFMSITTSEEEFSSPENMRREGTDCGMFEMPEVLQRNGLEKCDDRGRDLVTWDDEADRNKNQELDLSFADKIMNSTERESRMGQHFTCFVDPTNLTYSKDCTLLETQGTSSTAIKQPEKLKKQPEKCDDCGRDLVTSDEEADRNDNQEPEKCDECGRDLVTSDDEADRNDNQEFDVSLGDEIIRSKDKGSRRMDQNFTHSVKPTNSKYGKDCTYIDKTQNTSSTATKQPEKLKEQLDVRDGKDVHPSEKESRNKSKDVNFTSTGESATLKCDKACSHISETQSKSSSTMKQPEKSQKHVKEDSRHKSFHSSGKGSKRKNYSFTFNAPVNISLENYKDHCNCVSKSLNNRVSKLSKELSKHILEFCDKKKNISSREPCASTCNDLKHKSGPHESCANDCNYPNHESGIHESYAHACNNLNQESGVHESCANACNNLNKESESHERTSKAAVVSEKNSQSRSRKEMHDSSKRSFQKRKKYSTTAFFSKTQGPSPIPDRDVYSIVSESSKEAAPTFEEYSKSLKQRNRSQRSTRKSSEETIPTSRIFDNSILSPMDCERSEYAAPIEPKRCLAKPVEEFHFQDQESFGNYTNRNPLDNIQQQTGFNSSPIGCRASMRRRKLFDSNETVVTKVSKPRKKALSKKKKTKNAQRKKTIQERCDEYEEFLKTVPIDDLCYKSP